MRILIVRSGSGWGGYVGKYLVDTKEKVIVDIYEAYRLIKAEVYMDIERCLRLPLDSFPEASIKELKYEVHDLEYFLPTAEIIIEENYTFDHQTDHVYYLTEDNRTVCILDTSGNGEDRYLENPQLAKKLRGLMEVVSNA